jgi:ribosomal subunit interface protein
MQIPLQITMRDMERSDALEAAIHAHAAKLEQFHSRITRCRVTVEQLHRHHQQGRHFSVKFEMRIPGREIVATREHDEDVYLALRDAFDAAKRQLEDAARELRGEVKVHAPAIDGTVARQQIEDS